MNADSLKATLTRSRLFIALRQLDKATDKLQAAQSDAEYAERRVKELTYELQRFDKEATA